DDSADTTAQTVTLSTFTPSFDSDSPWGSITGLAPAAINYEYADTSSVSITTGSGADTVNVQATGVNTIINTRGGADTVNVGNNAHGVQDIIGSLFVMSTGGQSQLNIDDSADAVAKTAFLKFGFVPGLVGLSPAVIAYGSLSSLNITTGKGDDIV